MRWMRKWVTRRRATLHEIRCGECRVTWGSWAERAVGIKRGFTPKIKR